MAFITFLLNIRAGRMLEKTYSTTMRREEENRTRCASTQSSNNNKENPRCVFIMLKISTLFIYLYYLYKNLKVVFLEFKKVLLTFFSDLQYL